jgi:hypothetical protein
MKDSFCSSPWFHLRINPAGHYLPCRWGFGDSPTEHTVENTTLTEYMNSSVMRSLRTSMLEGAKPDMCKSCHAEDAVNKVSGRQRQLLKSAIRIEKFENTLCASPHYDRFKHSFDNNGHTNSMPVDLQIDLGNTCNSACLMCTPTYSSKLFGEHVKLHKIEPMLFKTPLRQSNWADNSTLLKKFVDELAEIPNVRYIHFLGGETLYLKSFYNVCNMLIERGMAKDIVMGTTTNCTIYTPELEHIIREFKEVHLGLSVESFNPINDYIRHPSNIDTVTKNIHKFLSLRTSTGLYTSLRITPSALSILHLDTVFEFMLENDVVAESCNILDDPACLGIDVVPGDILNEALRKIELFINNNKLTPTAMPIINRRRADLNRIIIAQLAAEYTHVLTASIRNNKLNLVPDFVRYISAFETLHNNKILGYLPEYEEFLRSNGYQG